MLWITHSITRLGEVAKGTAMLKNLRVYLVLNKLLTVALLTLALTALFVASPAAAEEAQKFEHVNQIGNWGLFEDGNTCWMAASASSSSRENVNLEEQKLYVTFFNGFPEPKISFYVPDCCDDDASVKTQHDEMLLVWFEDFYYPSRKDADEKLLMSLLNSQRVTVISDETDEQLLWFSLSGMRDAYSEVARTCKFLPMRMLRDENNVYKG